MPLYINDPEVSRLADELSAANRCSKTEIVRRLLKEQASRVERIRTAPHRIERMKELSRRAAKATAESVPPFTYTKKEADSLFEYLEPAAKPGRRKRRLA